MSDVTFISMAKLISWSPDLGGHHELGPKSSSNCFSLFRDGFILTTSNRLLHQRRRLHRRTLTGKQTASSTFSESIPVISKLHHSPAFLFSLRSRLPLPPLVTRAQVLAKEITSAKQTEIRMWMRGWVERFLFQTRLVQLCYLWFFCMLMVQRSPLLSPARRGEKRCWLVWERSLMEVFEGAKHFNEWKIKRRGAVLKSARCPGSCPLL